MKYTEVAFTCRGGEEWQKDLLIQDLAKLGFDIFEEREEGFAGFIASANFDNDAVDLLLLQQPEGFLVSYTHRDIEPQNWNSLWESNFNPIEIDQRCYVRATFHDARPEYPFEIVIDPKMAFGTGHHQTTSMMMRLLLELDVAGKAVLDMGCGTGILGILAAKKHAASVMAIDNDEICCSSAHENALLNGISAMDVKCGSVDLIKGSKFNIILANINRNVLIEHLPYYAQALVKDGVLLISGFFLGDDLGALTTEASRWGLHSEAHLADGNWAAARFVKLK